MSFILAKHNFLLYFNIKSVILVLENLPPHKQIKKMKATKRFLKYTIIGTSTFILDLALLYLLNDFFNLNYLFSAGLAYLISVSINYYIARKLIFAKTERKFDHGYYYFILITGAGLIFIVLLMALLVEVFNLEPFLSRILIAGAVGMWNYLMNLFFNFKMAGKY